MLTDQRRFGAEWSATTWASAGQDFQFRTRLYQFWRISIPGLGPVLPIHHQIRTSVRRILG